MAVNCTRITSSTAISTTPCFFHGIIAPIKSDGSIDVYNASASGGAVDSARIIPSQDVSTTAVTLFLPAPIRCPNGLYVKLTTANEAYVLWN